MCTDVNCKLFVLSLLSHSTNMTISHMNSSWLGPEMPFHIHKFLRNTYTACFLTVALLNFCIVFVFFCFFLFFYRAHIGKRPKTFWSWLYPVQPALLFQKMCNAPTVLSPAAHQKLPSRAYSTTLPKSCLGRLWTSTLTSQRLVSYFP